MLAPLIHLTTFSHHSEDWPEVRTFGFEQLPLDIFQISIFLVGLPTGLLLDEIVDRHDLDIFNRSHILDPRLNYPEREHFKIVNDFRVRENSIRVVSVDESIV